MPSDPSSKIPTLAIVGRPNVGKSSLFNRIVGRRQSIVHEYSGVTRDRVTARTVWSDRPFLLIDTGGLGYFQDQKGSGFDPFIHEQLVVAVETADVIIQVVEAGAGVMPLDAEVAKLLRPHEKKVVVAVNKADNHELEDSAGQFTALGFGEPLAVSTLHNRNLDELMRQAVADFPTVDELPPVPALNIAVVGRPNVGKSSSVNRLLGEERVIVCDVPGTTRDAVDVPFTMTINGEEHSANLIDTAGLRRKSRIDTPIEFFSMTRTNTAVKRSDFVIHVLDATAIVTAQDKKIARMVADAGKPCILLANKWDVAGEEMKQSELLDEIGRRLPFVDYAEIIICCAVSGYNFDKIFPTILRLREQQMVEIPTPVVNQVIQDTVARMPPPMASTGQLKISYGLQTSSTPPSFLLFVNNKRNCRPNYLSYLRNQFRRAFGFTGLPVIVELRSKPRHAKGEERESGPKQLKSPNKARKRLGRRPPGKSRKRGGR
jgi:GTP-binding protein